MEQETKTPKSVSRQSGQLKIADDVVAIIAGLAISDQKGIEKLSKKNKNRGISIQMEEGQVVCNVDLSILQGCKVPELAGQVQENVKAAIENMTGLSVKAVNVNIVSMNMEKSAKEAQQQVAVRYYSTI